MKYLNSDCNNTVVRLLLGNAPSTNLHLIQVALIIRSFAIRGLDYSRTKKQGKTADNKGKTQIKPVLGLK